LPHAITPLKKIAPYTKRVQGAKTIKKSCASPDTTEQRLHPFKHSKSVHDRLQTRHIDVTENDPHAHRLVSFP
jgi:hypothetical protein